MTLDFLEFIDAKIIKFLCKFLIIYMKKWKNISIFECENENWLYRLLIGSFNSWSSWYFLDTSIEIFYFFKWVILWTANIFTPIYFNLIYKTSVQLVLFKNVFFSFLFIFLLMVVSFENSGISWTMSWLDESHFIKMPFVLLHLFVCT